MIQGKSVLAVIPARGGSKGIPKKNIKMFSGRPLIAYTIAAARNSASVDTVIVTTDSEDIADVARSFGAEVPFMRPAELALDSSKTIDAIVHARDTMARLGRAHDVVATLQPTSPLRRAQEIDGALEVFVEHGMLGLASVSEVTENPVLTRRIDESGVMHPLLPTSSTVRRQDMPKFWHVDGAIYINLSQRLDADTSLNDNPIAYVMPPLRSSDIDCIEDFIRAEEILKELDGATVGDGR